MNIYSYCVSTQWPRIRVPIQKSQHQQMKRVLDKEREFMKPQFSIWITKSKWIRNYKQEKGEGKKTILIAWAQKKIVTHRPVALASVLGFLIVSRWQLGPVFLSSNGQMRTESRIIRLVMIDLLAILTFFCLFWMEEQQQIRGMFVEIKNFQLITHWSMNRNVCRWLHQNICWTLFSIILSCQKDMS